MTEIPPRWAATTEVANVVAELHLVRMARKVTQAEVCEASGLGHAVVSRLETDTGYYSHKLVTHLAAYAAALGYTLRLVLVSEETPEVHPEFAGAGLE